MSDAPYRTDMAQFIFDKYVERAKKDVQVYPCHTNRASSIGHPCTRFLVLSRVAWDKVAPYDWGLQLIFREGNNQEKAIIRDLEDAGFNVIEQQRAFMMKDLNISGHIDGKILLDGYAYPFDAKSMSPFIFQAVKSMDDMMRHRYVHLRKYPAQIMSYLLLDEKETGLFILKNKTNGMIRPVQVFLDYQYMDGILKKVEIVNQHVAANTLPEHHEDKTVCEDCNFAHICLPERGSGVHFQDAGSVIELVDEFIALKKDLEAADVKGKSKRIDEIKDLLKTITEDKPVSAVGEYLIFGKWVVRSGKKSWQIEIK